MDVGIEVIADEGQLILKALRTIVKRGWLVHDTLPDTDSRFRKGFKDSYPLQTIDEWGNFDPDGNALPTPERETFTPADISRSMLVMGWMAWLRQKSGHGNLAVWRIHQWARGVALDSISDREARRQRRRKFSKQATHKRITSSLAAIAKEFLGIEIRVDGLNELAEVDRSPPSFGDRVFGVSDSQDDLRPGKVWIGVLDTYMIYGKPYNPEGRMYNRTKTHWHLAR